MGVMEEVKDHLSRLRNGERWVRRERQENLWFPDEIVGVGKCHLRALFALGIRADGGKLLHTDVKAVLAATKNLRKGAIFRLMDHHWVSIIEFKSRDRKWAYCDENCVYSIAPGRVWNVANYL